MPKAQRYYSIDEVQKMVHEARSAALDDAIEAVLSVEGWSVESALGLVITPEEESIFRGDALDAIERIWRKNNE